MVTDEYAMLAERIFQNSLQLPVWHEKNITIFGHYLLGIHDTDSTQEIINKWLSGDIVQTDIQKFHRGEFLCILSEFNCDTDDTITFQDGSWVTVNDIISYEREIFTVSDQHYFNEKEEYYGQEYGWLIKGFSHYLASGTDLVPGYTTKDLAEHLMEKGINRNFEEGAHDLEALARLRKILKSDSLYRHPLCIKIGQFLDSLATYEIEFLSPEGQAYAYSRRFDGSIIGGKSTFRTTLDNLNRQAHLIEWLSEAELIYKVAKSPLILSRFGALIKSTKNIIDERLANDVKSVHYEDILIVSSLSHMMSAIRKLKAVGMDAQ